MLYASFYGMYFGHVANSLKPDLNFVDTPGSPERLHAKQKNCYRFAMFMLIPTLLEAMGSSWFTSLIISVLPCIFGFWVMHAVWREVFRSKMPKSQRLNHPQR